MPAEFKLFQEPFRHYKASTGPDSWSWTSNKRRIASVTQILDGGQDNLTRWSASQALIAAEQVLQRAMGKRRSKLLRENTLAELLLETGLLPEQVRDAKADIGTLAHSYLAARLVSMPAAPSWPGLPAGYLHAVDAFLEEHRPIPAKLADGSLAIERAVGCRTRALAGTYDFQAYMPIEGTPGVHRADLKSSNTVQPKHFVQLAGYEEMAVQCGEAPSDYLTIVHVDGCGNFKLHTIAVGSDDHKCALRVWHAAIVQYRDTRQLAKLLKYDPDAEPF